MNDILAGAWVYRSFLNVQDHLDPTQPLGERLLFGQGELVFDSVVGHDDVRGQLSFRSDPPTQQDARLEMVGRIEHGTPHRIRLRGTGVAGTSAEGWVYDYVGYLAPEWADGKDQVPAIVGTVIRSAAHGNAPAGVVASFVAVAQEFPEPRIVIPLPEPVIRMLAGEKHRLHHLLWHSLRQFWLSRDVSDETREHIRKLGWEPPRLGTESGKTAVDNGSGIDFLFMHREMISHVAHMMHGLGLDPIQHWSEPPQPGAVRAEPDFTRAHPELPVPGNPDGFVVPPAWHWPSSLNLERRIHALKSDEYYWSRMRWWDREFKNPERLSRLTLGQLGALLEFSIHNDMHMRWASVPRLAEGTKVPAGRGIGDIDSKWADPSNDYLGDFYSSHVNPVFWRLHGWVDDRIEDWFAAHEAAHPGEVQRTDVGGLPWFHGKNWVEHDQPWAKPQQGFDVDTMKQVVHLLFPPPLVDPVAAITLARPAVVSQQSATEFFFGRELETPLE
ncbi:hypothetical protein [Rhodopirellula baltica]|uniref:Uncharacterized protein n=1 Tax=Rhodopirellula baltica (strain DSM 10527 / NCIMB 13988 / SH1) TaxID=243090 RepID=Q7USV2_RHOBA|nr:hypothetical protein [Rhodopirellula baltica]CAD73690.1 conserved hypothetical protein [Rhodopirellula baltica SH 1]